ncbi:Mu-like prophage protein gp46 (gp46) [Commensalibacter communis]|uniref:Mu-like prophage protein gp46 (Gp46) n=1 Tax=Commensalibacter communis TaxID=2972786 RepID=A0A9W4TSP1_9PROT|nr:phage GP46 family protein [Commensalibacter communis]CAI3953320.1 Mu-like prophage protein gp46 (gp46) [Commensalibacter communis]CAI3956379.1 Mu-like prophage protein gp46 (gp46) [Commensalibacter communis]CAI3956852.1 Mu-like prophage protein gp46 (gp46) [Commensalibacter communis]CAI3957264.1 Mu-like prophage protein gp46 (gp46) [Commensalibacter communis]
MTEIKDIGIVWYNETGKGEWHVENGDIATDYAIYSAVMVSLFSDRVAPLEPSQHEKNAAIGKVDGDRRGWWGDMLRDEPIGSRLWQLKRAIKADRSSVPASAQDMIYEALSWMVESGLVDSMSADVNWVSPGLLQFSIQLKEPKQYSPKNFLFSWAWEGI